jgi:hypothetical protein
LPTAQLPEFGEKKVNLTKEEIDMEASFPDNFEGVLYGVVDPDAEKITFEVVDLFRSFIWESEFKKFQHFRAEG